MKVVIAGGRYIDLEPEDIDEIVKKSGFEVRELVNGDCDTGVDPSAAYWAKLREIKMTAFPAHWGEFGRKAGPLRNKEMARYADALIAVWDGESRGTKNMIKEMEDLGKPVFIYIIA